MDPDPDLLGPRLGCGNVPELKDVGGASSGVDDSFHMEEGKQ